ncbi:MAG: FG-GAP repeat protein [Planctomycetota bacterium]
MALALAGAGSTGFGQITEGAKLSASDAALDDHFGHATAIFGDTAIVGAHLNDHAGVESGSAYVYENQGGSWVETDRLTASDAQAGALFGASVSLLGDLALVGASASTGDFPIAGAAYLFEKQRGAWTETAKLVATKGEVGDRFGYSVSLSEGVAIVGAHWDTTAGFDAGAAYIFEDRDGAWVESVKLIGPDEFPLANFGYSVSISGDTAFVGAPVHSAVYVYEKQGGVWLETARLTVSGVSLLGHSVSMSGKVALVGAPGAVYVFEKQGGFWVETDELAGSGSSSFGQSVALRDDLAVVGASEEDAEGIAGSGAAYVFRRQDGAWIETDRLVASDGAEGDRFGSSVSVFDKIAFVGAYGNDDAGADSGSAYVFDSLPTSFPAAALPIDGCGINPPGSLTVLNGLPSVGSTLVLGVENPLGTQAAGSATALLFCLAPDEGVDAGGCGTFLPGLGMAGAGAAGELLIDPASLFSVESGFPWSPASPAPFSLAIPNSGSLVDTSIYVQGFLVDASLGAVAPIGLTEALNLQIGF